MIQESLHFLQNTLNQFMKNSFDLDEESVIVNQVIDPDGSIPEKNQNKLVISLIHIEQETARPFHTRNQKLANGNYMDKPIDQRYNLFILVVPNFDDYNESLKFLNASLKFFQIHAALDAISYSTIPKGVGRLEFEFQKHVDYMETYNLWSALGAKYQPSVVYKMKLITIVSDEATGFEKAITKTSNAVSA